MMLKKLMMVVMLAGSYVHASEIACINKVDQERLTGQLIDAIRGGDRLKK